MEQSAPYSAWRRMVLAEAAQVEIDLRETRISGSPYPDVADYEFDTYLKEADEEVAAARQTTRNDWPKGLRRLTYAVHEWVRVWSGSEHETAAAALHRAEGLLLMIASDFRLRSEALKIEAIFKATADIPMSDPRHSAYEALFRRIKGPSDSGGQNGRIQLGDRVLLREVRREQNEAWEVARSRVRIFRNILSMTIPVLTAALVVASFIAWSHPNLISLRGTTGTPDAYDVAVVEFLGMLGGLLSAVATLSGARNFQRFWGLPLAQSILKLPVGSASALVGVLLLQHGLFGSIGPLSWEAAESYALVFGVAQIAVTKHIDARAGDLLGEANAKSPSTAQTNSAASVSGDGG